MNIKSRNTKILGNFTGMSFAPRFDPNGKKLSFLLLIKENLIFLYRI